MRRFRIGAMTSQAPLVARSAVLRTTPPVAAKPRRGGLLVAMGALAIGAFVLAPVSLLAIRRTAIGERSTGVATAQVAAEGMRFVPAEIRVARGATVKVEFSNHDP